MTVLHSQREAFAQLAQNLALATNAKQAAMAILETADDIIGWDACFLLFARDGGRYYQNIVNIDTDNGERKEFPAVNGELDDKFFSSRCLKEGKFLLQFADEASTRAMGSAAFGTKRPSLSMLFAPLRKGNDHIGVISIQSYQPQIYSENDLELLQILADYCTGALERAYAEEQLRDQQRLTQEFADLGRSLARAGSPREAAEIIMESADRLFGWDASFINIYDEENDSLNRLFAKDLIDGQRQDSLSGTRRVTPGRIARRVLEEGPLLIRRPKDSTDSGGLENFGDRGRISNTLMFTPIRLGQRNVGLMSVQSYSYNAYCEDQLEQFRALGDHCAGALARCLAETMLEKNQELLQLVSSQMPAVVWSVDTKLNFTMLMGDAAKALREPPEELAGMPLLDYLPRDENSERIVTMHLRALRGESVSFETELAGRLYQCNVEPLLNDQGELIGAISISHDITARKEAEERIRRASEELEARVAERTAELTEANELLRRQIAEREKAESSHFQSLALLKATLESTADGIIVTDIAGQALNWNGTAATQWKLPDSPAQPFRTIEDIVTPHLIDEGHFAALHDSGQEKAADARPLELTTREGRTYEVFSKEQIHEGEASGRVWSFRDITLRKQAETAILQSEETYRRAIQAASGVPYKMRHDQPIYDFMGEGVIDLLGIPSKNLRRDRLIGMMVEYDILDSGVPDDIRELGKAFRRGEIPLYRVDTRVVNARGEEKWINDCSIPLKDDQTGAVIGSLGILQDITARKKAEIEARLRSESERELLERENTRLKKQLRFKELENPAAFANLITANDQMHIIFRIVESIAKTNQPVLIYGETGVGKELMAKAIHEVSGREGEFVPVNVAGLDDEMFSDTLFGHTRGAFTGAMKERRGLVESAANGTLFLDEIGDLGKNSQVKLLRLLQEREFYPLGADAPKRTNARIVVATNQDLNELIHSGDFRQDLFYRLQTHKVDIPPLRERKEDIPLLADHFLERAAEQLDKQIPTPPPQLYTLLSNYHFPGNIRELEAMMFDAVSKHQAKVLSLEVFHQRIEQERGPLNNTATPRRKSLGVSFGDTLPTLKEATESLIEEALRRTANNQSMAARMLGISQQALNRRVRNKQKAGKSNSIK